MKKLLFYIILLFLNAVLFAQGYGENTKADKWEKERNEKNSELLKDVFIKVGENNFEYCQIVGSQKFLSSTINIQIDFGQEFTLFEDLRLKDENNKPVIFNTMIDALNYMGKFGWEFEQAYALTVGNQNVFHFLLKRIKN